MNLHVLIEYVFEHFAPHHLRDGGLDRELLERRGNRGTAVAAGFSHARID